MARIISRSETSVSPWVRVVEHTVEIDAQRPAEAFHSLAQADYVSVLARRASGHIPIVSQFRPAIGDVTWELPGGLLDAGESPEACCRRELREETGAIAARVISLGSFFPDTGRLENLAWLFAAEISDVDSEFVGEPGVEVAWVTPAELRAQILSGRFRHLLHIGALAAAKLHGFDVGVIG